MYLNNLKSFVNSLVNSKLYTVVTLVGFTISLTFVILLSAYIKKELTINSSQKNASRIYRLINENAAEFAPPIGLYLQNKFPEIESYTRILENSGKLVTQDNVKVKFDFLAADSTFFTIFSFNLIEGNPETALKTKNAVVLSREFANKIFGNKSSLNQKITVDGIDCIVKGIVDDISKTSNFDKCDAIINFRCLADLWKAPHLLTSMGNSSFGLYFLAKPNSDLPSKASQVLEMFKKDYWLYQNERVKTVDFEPLADNYFSHIPARATHQNTKTFIAVLFAIVILILVLAIINYMNLTIAQSGARVKETALKKLFGSSRRKLVFQHVNESIILCFVAFLLAMFLSFLAEPIFNSLLGTQLNLVGEFTINTILITLVLVVLIGFVSGIIPAFIITRLSAVQVFKGEFRQKSKSVYSKLLIGFQYIVVIVLIISTVVIARQTAFMQNYSLGFKTSNIVWLDNNLSNSEMAGFKNEMNKIPGVKKVSFVKGSPLDRGDNRGYTYEDKPVSFQLFIVDSSFLSMMEMNITSTGVGYTKEGIWINRVTVDKLGLDPLPKSFKAYNGEKPVLGIIDNFHFESLHREIGMAIIEQMSETDYPRKIFIQLEGNSPISVLEKVKRSYDEYANGQPFDYGFVDETTQSWYDSEKKTATIVSYFAMLSILISVMGIFAMSVFYNLQKIKEIGIRKVNGATVFQIIKLLNLDFIKWVAISFVIACPIAYYAMNKWLQKFPYKITLDWWVFVFAGIFAIIVALLTVSWQSFKAARRNPVEALRYE
ncbi:FtsX-like permease family protein [Lentimicrobium sp. L6]|uniref:ABC transporter permease n=1 Tax=Lentimicrobium sp. L6 TaxID=2735916 RepID=UPI00155177B4|nr:ABC transporter permease [Lentimicrobium sp. L6]NPD84745.1 FtsX-like permease family protein [Lentimicrobium sp. L6]